jgi:hypothetical protein
VIESWNDVDWWRDDDSYGYTRYEMAVDALAEMKGLPVTLAGEWGYVLLLGHDVDPSF